MRKSLKLIIYFILLFFLYFGFNLYGINTRYWATAVLLLLLVILPRCASKFFILFSSSENTKILKVLVFYLLVVLGIPIIHSTFDLNIAFAAFRLIVFYIDCLILYAILPKEYSRFLLRGLIGIFVIQSLIILTAFASPSILELVRRFQFENMMEITANYLDYGTYRGLALAGEQFHGLTVAYGLVAIVAMKQYLDENKIKWLIFFFLLFAANMFVGRTGFIGFGLAMFYMIWVGGRKTFVLILKLLVLLAFLLLVSYNFLPANIKTLLNDNVFSYAFQLFYNYRESGHMETSSTSRVIEMWQEDFSFKTFLFGDGRFLNSDGTYYRQVDVGYLRHLFYGGIFFILYSILSVYKMLIGYSSKIRYSDYKLEMTIFLFLLIVHAKGIDFMYASEPMLIVFIYYIHQYIDKTKGIYA